MGAHHSKPQKAKPHSAPILLSADRRTAEPILDEAVRYGLSPSSVRSSKLILEEVPVDVEGAEAEEPNVTRTSSLLAIDASDLMRPARDADLAALFPADRYGLYEMGGVDDFVGGLGAMLGPPNPALMETMLDEHTMRFDSKLEFANAPYWIITTSETEWHFVLDPEGCLPKLGLASWPSEGADAISKCSAMGQVTPLCAEDRRKPIPLSAFYGKLERHNEVLKRNKVRTDQAIPEPPYNRTSPHHERKLFFCVSSST